MRRRRGFKTDPITESRLADNRWGSVTASRMEDDAWAMAKLKSMVADEAGSPSSPMQSELRGQSASLPDPEAYKEAIGPKIAKPNNATEVWTDRLLGGDATHGLGAMDAVMAAYIAPKIWQSVKETGGSDAEAFGSAAMDTGLQVAGQVGGNFLGRAIGGMIGSAGGPVGTMIGQMVGNMVAGEVSNAILSNAAEGRMKRRFADQPERGYGQPYGQQQPSAISAFYQAGGGL